jgi:hypothetical protein
MGGHYFIADISNKTMEQQNNGTTKSDKAYPPSEDDLVRLTFMGRNASDTV